MFNPTEDDPRNEWGIKDWYDETIRLGAEIARLTAIETAVRVITDANAIESAYWEEELVLLEALSATDTEDT